MDGDRFDVIEGTIAAHKITVLYDRQTGQSWILDGQSRHDAQWRPISGGPTAKPGDERIAPGIG
jgi:hypothetical protein